MPKVKNLKGKGVSLLRYRILPDGRVQDPHGHILNLLPHEIAHTSQALRLVKEGYIEIEGLSFQVQVVKATAGSPAKVVLKDKAKALDTAKPEVKSKKDE